jgi:hypothetical protein
VLVDGAFDWGPDRDPVVLGPAVRRSPRRPAAPWFLDRPEVADWVLLPVLVMVAGLALRRVWPRPPSWPSWSGSADTSPPGATFPLVFLAPALASTLRWRAAAPVGAADSLSCR